MMLLPRSDKPSQDDPRTVLHWYDFLCPFCYVGQHRTAILVRHGLQVEELPFQAHPDTGHCRTSTFWYGARIQSITWQML
jgi:hypothetical protein